MTSKSPSTLSLQSQNTIDSTTPLNIGTSRKPQKDYATALSTLQARYGTRGNIPSPKKTPSKKFVEKLAPISELSSTSSQTEVPSPSITSEASGSSTTFKKQTRKKLPDSKQTSSFLKLLFKDKKQKS